MLGCLDITNIVCYKRIDKKTVSPVHCPTPTKAVTAIKPYQGGTKPLYYNTFMYGHKKCRHKICSADASTLVDKLGQRKDGELFWNMQEKSCFLPKKFIF